MTEVPRHTRTHTNRYGEKQIVSVVQYSRREQPTMPSATAERHRMERLSRLAVTNQPDDRDNRLDYLYDRDTERWTSSMQHTKMFGFVHAVIAQTDEGRHSICLTNEDGEPLRVHGFITSRQTGEAELGNAMETDTLEQAIRRSNDALLLMSYGYQGAKKLTLIYYGEDGRNKLVAAGSDQIKQACVDGTLPDEMMSPDLLESTIAEFSAEQS